MTRVLLYTQEYTLSSTICLASVMILPQIGQNTISTFCSDQPRRWNMPQQSCRFDEKMVIQRIFRVFCLQTNPYSFFLHLGDMQCPNIYESICAWVSHFESLYCRSPSQPGVQAAGAQSPPGSALPRYHRKAPSRSKTYQNQQSWFQKCSTQFVWLRQPSSFSCHCRNCMSRCTKTNQHVQV